jgi:hypothetical protein
MILDRIMNAVGIMDNFLSIIAFDFFGMEIEPARRAIRQNLRVRGDLFIATLSTLF